MSVEVTNVIWIGGLAATAHYGPVTAYGEAECGQDEDLLDQLIAELEAKAEALGPATHVIGTVIDVTVTEKGHRWALEGSAVRLERVPWG